MRYPLPSVRHCIYYMSKKTCPILYSEYTIKIGQDFLDIKYLDFEEAVDDLGLAVGGTGELVADLVVQQRLQTGFIGGLSYFVLLFCCCLPCNHRSKWTWVKI